MALLKALLLAAVVGTITAQLQTADVASAKYAFQYAVNDPHTGDHKEQHEERDGDVVRGFYSLIEPDGNLRRVDYTADNVNGFQAVVSRQAGAAQPIPIPRAVIAQPTVRIQPAVVRVAQPAAAATVISAPAVVHAPVATQIVAHHPVAPVTQYVQSAPTQYIQSLPAQYVQAAPVSTQIISQAPTTTRIVSSVPQYITRTVSNSNQYVLA